MDTISLVRAVLAWATEHHRASEPLAKTVLEWTRKHAHLLYPVTRTAAKRLNWTALKALARTSDAPESEPSEVMRLGNTLARLLELDEADTRILLSILAFEREPLFDDLAYVLWRELVDKMQLLQVLSGVPRMEAERRVRNHAVFRYALVEFDQGRNGRTDFWIRWSLEQLLDRMPEDEEGIIEALVGARSQAALDAGAFAHVEEFELLVRLLKGAATQGAPGISVLLHGPPGTGKTEMARSLAAAAGVACYGVGEMGSQVSEPSRDERIGALRLGHSLLRNRRDTVLLFDEMEDVIGDADKSSGGRTRRRPGSKVYMNRLVETGALPVIWTTNSIDGLDDALLRRMSMVVHMDYPAHRAAHALVERVSAEEGVAPSEAMLRLAGDARETATVARVSARAARLAGEDDGAPIARSLVRALRGGTLPQPGPGDIDLALYETDRPIGELCASLCRSGASDISMLLTGPPGTGKTALAHHFARALDRPLMVKRASDLLSKWVGGTEARIAAAFESARRDEAVLFFDEADSLLFDRTTARANWEVGQVNELLSWLDRHPYPVLAATNFDERLDPATKRRFVYKLALRSLSPGKAAGAWVRFFNRPAPAALARVERLTPGDFAVVARQIRHEGDLCDAAILARLCEEVAAKGGGAARMGF